MADRQLGRRPPKHAPALMLGRALTGTVPAHPATADHLAQVKAWMLGANDRFGTCGPTSVANYLVMAHRYLLGEDITVTDAAVFDLYRRSGNPDFDPATGAGDQGVDMQTMLESLVQGGMTITHADGKAETVKPVAFAKVDTADFDQVRAATSIFGGVLFGLNLETTQQTQTDQGGPWDYVQSSDWGGHATMGGEYTSQAGPHQVDESNVTWAEVIGTTDAFMSHQLAEAWVVIMPEHLAHPAFQTGVDLVQLAADYKALTGKDLPLPQPSPAPGPQPNPTPAPAPPPSVLQWFVQEVERLPQEVADWIRSHMP